LLRAGGQSAPNSAQSTVDGGRWRTIQKCVKTSIPWSTLSGTKLDLKTTSAFWRDLEGEPAAIPPSKPYPGQRVLGFILIDRSPKQLPSGAGASTLRAAPFAKNVQWDGGWDREQGSRRRAMSHSEAVQFLCFPDWSGAGQAPRSPNLVAKRPLACRRPPGDVLASDWATMVRTGS